MRVSETFRFLVSKVKRPTPREKAVCRLALHRLQGDGPVVLQPGKGMDGMRGRGREPMMYIVTIPSIRKQAGCGRLQRTSAGGTVHVGVPVSRRDRPSSAVERIWISRRRPVSRKRKRNTHNKETKDGRTKDPTGWCDTLASLLLMFSIYRTND
ncbi:hypothetical protein LZ30DRAFT_725927 [Colletotrichum cereale]|nr:hypothetical protein LZ30DRAFT_725927 [Colletotrichum cereale]